AGMGTAMVVGKAKFGILSLPGGLDEYKYVPFSPWTGKKITDEALRILGNHKIRFLFVHYPFPDHAGHAHGWLSDKYFRETAETDKELSRLVAFLEKDQKSRTLLIITSDHGGHGKTHGTSSREDRTIPWIAWGPSVRPGFPIQGKMNIFDTVPVILEALGLPGKSETDGHSLPDIWREGTGSSCGQRRGVPIGQTLHS
ncbi:MAG: alkaline phosphatase, partial [Armatimonadetes bacterium]|nr:alkaline phosphatase [Armatimonadota bacterium]